MEIAGVLARWPVVGCLCVSNSRRLMQKAACSCAIGRKVFAESPVTGVTASGMMARAAETSPSVLASAGAVGAKRRSTPGILATVGALTAAGDGSRRLIGAPQGYGVDEARHDLHPIGVHMTHDSGDFCKAHGRTSAVPSNNGPLCRGGFREPQH